MSERAFSFIPVNERPAKPRAHRLFFGARIEQVGPAPTSRTIERAVFAVAAFRFVPDQRITELIRDVEAIERQKRVEAEKASSGENWESYALELDTELEDAKQTIAALEAENENLNQVLTLIHRLEAASCCRRLL
jgi:hypothetical protein